MSERDAIQAYREVCESLVIKGQGTLRWAWDDRWHAALAQISRELAVPAKAILEAEFPQRWNTRSIVEAPAAVRGLVEHIDLRGEQLLHTTPNDPLLYASWWPWANGAMFSVRVSCYSTKWSESRWEANAKELRPIFGL